MASMAHEILVDLFRNRPSLAAEILTEALGVPLPSYTEARLASIDLTQVQPAEYRADVVVLSSRHRSRKCSTSRADHRLQRNEAGPPPSSPVCNETNPAHLQRHRFATERSRPTFIVTGCDGTKPAHLQRRRHRIPLRRHRIPLRRMNSSFAGGEAVEAGSVSNDAGASIALRCVRSSVAGVETGEAGSQAAKRREIRRTRIPIQRSGDRSRRRWIATSEAGSQPATLAEALADDAGVSRDDGERSGYVAFHPASLPCDPATMDPDPVKLEAVRLRFPATRRSWSRGNEVAWTTSDAGRGDANVAVGAVTPDFSPAAPAPAPAPRWSASRAAAGTAPSPPRSA